MKYLDRIATSSGYSNVVLSGSSVRKAGENMLFGQFRIVRKYFVMAHSLANQLSTSETAILVPVKTGLPNRISVFIEI